MSRSRQKKKKRYWSIGNKQHDTGDCYLRYITIFSFMEGSFVLFLIFFYFSGTFKHCPGHRNGHAISWTIPDVSHVCYNHQCQPLKQCKLRCLGAIFQCSHRDKIHEIFKYGMCTRNNKFYITNFKYL